MARIILQTVRSIKCVHLFVDEFWEDDIKTRRSTARILAQVGTNLVDWSSKLQTIIFHSTADDEFIAVDSATQIKIRFRLLLRDLGNRQKQATVLHEDNPSCMVLSAEKDDSLRQSTNVLGTISSKKRVVWRNCFKVYDNVSAACWPPNRPTFEKDIQWIHNKYHQNSFEMIAESNQLSMQKLLSLSLFNYFLLYILWTFYFNLNTRYSLSSSASKLYDSSERWSGKCK